jgi:hypothetical protein
VTIATSNLTESAPLIYINGVPVTISPVPPAPAGPTSEVIKVVEQREKLGAKLSKFIVTIPSKFINLISMTMKQRMRSKKAKMTTTATIDRDSDVAVPDTVPVPVAAPVGPVARAAERAARKEVGVSTWAAPADW